MKNVNAAVVRIYEVEDALVGGRGFVVRAKINGKNVTVKPTIGGISTFGSRDSAQRQWRKYALKNRVRSYSYAN